MKQITIVVLILSLIAMAMGGWSDFNKKKYIISKEHYWSDGTYLLLLAIFLELFW